MILNIKTASPSGTAAAYPFALSTAGHRPPLAAPVHAAGAKEGLWQGAPLLCLGREAAEALGLQRCRAGPKGGGWMGLGADLR